MSDKQTIAVIGGAIALIIGVIIFALYNEGILMKNTYENRLLNYSINIPRSYQLGLQYMEYVDQRERGGIAITSSEEFIPEEAEVVVLTTQDKSEQEKNVMLLQRTPDMELEQVCDCVVIRPNDLPEPMANFLRDRDINDGIAATTTPLSDAQGQSVPVYSNSLSAAAVNAFNQPELREIEHKKYFTHLFFPEPFEFALESEYYEDISYTVYGLTLSLFTTDTQTASLQDIVEVIEF